MESKLRKILIRMMKYATYSIIVQISLYSAFALDGKAQKGLDEVYLNLGFEEARVVKAFQEIEAQTEFRFAYKRSELPNTRIVISKEKRTLAELLKDISGQSSLSFRRIDQTIHVKPAREGAADLVEERSIAPLRVTGTVTDENGEALPGATVVEKGSTNGTVTDVDGKFALDVPEDAVLLVSFVGYITKEVPVANQTAISVSLQPDYKSLEEVVVVGYGTQKKSDVTGSVTSVPADRLKNLPVTDITQAIQGTVAGLNITQGSSVPGSSGSMQIRGVNSINANTSPFIVVDGTPFYGGINDINMNNVESIEVLKDASAVAIYGTRGSNGVILITTKRGKVGKPNITYSGYYGLQDIPQPLEPMDKYTFTKKYRDYMIARGLTQTSVLLNNAENENFALGRTTDWLDEATQIGNLSEHNVSANGGTENARYFVSGSYLTQDGVVKGYQYQRANFRSNLDVDVTDYLNFGVTAFFSHNNYDGGRANLLNATAMSPYSIPRDENGEYIIFPMSPEQLFENPLLGLTTDRKDRSTNLSGTVFAELRPGIEGLQYRINASYYYNPKSRAFYEGRAANNQSGYGETFNSETKTWVVENILTYNKDFGKHHVDLTLLYSAQETDYFESFLSGSGFVSDALLYNNIEAAENVGGSSESNRTALLSQMARLNYSYDSRYLFTVTARRDGYSAFGANTSKYGFFPSVAVGWNAHNESFLASVDPITQMKLRLSYGETGNQSLDPYQTQNLSGTVLFPFGGTALIGTYISGMGNSDLIWETTASTNLALDFGLFRHRVSGTVELYKTVTNDILLQRNIPSITGTNSIWDNIGKMQNEGLEVTLNTVNVETGDFSWETTVNFSTYRNEILELYGDGEDDIANNWFIGKPLQAIYTYKQVGIWQEGEATEDWDPSAQPGDIKFEDINDDGQIDSENDRVYQGSSLPTWTGGLTNRFNYKNFSLSVFIQTSQGVLKGNPDVFYGDEAGRRNIPADVGYWTPENQSNEFPSLAYTNTRGYWFPRDASYVRIKDVRLSYRFPQGLVNRMKINALTVYAAGRNLYTFTDWIGWDPESTQDSRGSGNWENNYPYVRTFSVGLNVTL